MSLAKWPPQLSVASSALQGSVAVKFNPAPSIRNHTANNTITAQVSSFKM